MVKNSACHWKKPWSLPFCMTPFLKYTSLEINKKKNSPGNARDVGSIPGLGRSPGVRNGTPLQYSCLGNPVDRGAWWAAVHGAAKSQIQLNTPQVNCARYGRRKGCPLTVTSRALETGRPRFESHLHPQVGPTSSL